jgi:ribosomal protein L11 methyltransferase
VIEEPYLQEPDGDNLRVDPSKPVTIRTFLPAADTDPDTLEEIRRSLFHLNQIRPVGDLVVTARNEEDWANAWKAHYQPVRVGNRVVVRPPWRDYEARLADVVVVLDPGMAFGTGTHPSTRLAMLGLEQVLRHGDSVLDVGTGSGVLAIAAKKLGAGRVDACDIEPVAVRSARENVERNGLAGEITIEEGSAGPNGPFPGTYDVVVANIIARILIEITDDLVHSVAPNGVLILSGVIQDREADVADAFEKRDFEVFWRDQIEDWVGMILRRRG